MKQRQWDRAAKWIEGAREYPERLGTGKPHNPNYLMHDALQMLCHAGAGDTAKADQDWARLAAQRGAAADRAQLDQWSRTSLQSQPPLAALRDLNGLVRGR